MNEKKLPEDSKLANERVASSFSRFKSIVDRKKKSVAVLIVFIVAVISVFYFVLPHVRRESFTREESVQEETSEEQTTTFENIGDASKDEFVEYQRALEEGIDYWKNWVWDENLIYAHIKKVDKVNTEMLVYVNPPDYATFSRSNFLLNIKCPKTSTVAIKDVTSAGEADVLGRGFDIFEKAQPDDVLVTYCLDEECINAGKQCILIVRDY